MFRLTTDLGRLLRALEVVAVLAVAAVTGLFMCNLATVRRFDSHMASHALRANAGIVLSVPIQVSDALALVGGRADEGGRYRLSEDLEKDPFIQQRMWEALYPTRFAQDSELPVISTFPVTQEGACVIKARGVYVAIAECR
jgi:hypothetical protein